MTNPKCIQRRNPQSTRILQKVNLIIQNSRTQSCKKLMNTWLSGEQRLEIVSNISNSWYLIHLIVLFSFYLIDKDQNTKKIKNIRLKIIFMRFILFSLKPFDIKGIKSFKFLLRQLQTCLRYSNLLLIFSQWTILTLWLFQYSRHCRSHFLLCCKWS